MNKEVQSLTTNKDQSDIPANCGQIVRTMIPPILAVLFTITAVWGYTIVRAGDWIPMSSELIYAAVLAITATVAGMGILSAVFHYHCDYLPQGIMAAMGIKMFIILAGFLIFALILKPVRLEFVLYMAIFYLTGLVSETVITIKMTRRMNHSSGPADKTQR